MARYRSRMTRRRSRKVFSRTARKVHKRNRPSRFMRGGIRL